MNISEQDLTALKLISDYKWANGYKCRLCGSEGYYSGSVPTSRKCKNQKCKKEETATANTVFERLRIPIHAALHLVKVFAKQKNHLSILQCRSQVENDIAVQLKPKSIWEMMLKVYYNMDYINPVFDKNVVVITASPVYIIIGEMGGVKKYRAVFIRKFETLFNDVINKTANITKYDYNELTYPYTKPKIVEFNGGVEVDGLNPREVIADFRTIFYDINENHWERLKAHMNLYTFVKNQGTFEDLMIHLTTNYRKNQSLLGKPRG